MKKALLIGGGIAVAVLGVGYLLLRKKDQPALGDTVYDYSTRYLRYNSYAASQIAQAGAGSRLSDYKSAAHAGEMINYSTTNAEAHIKAAYWLAVASRLTGSKATAADAAWHATKAQWWFMLPGSSYYTGEIAQIMRDAASKLPSSSNKGIKSIGVILGRQADQKDIDTKIDSRASTSDNVVAAIKKTGNDINPLGKEKPWWVKWAWGAGLGVVALVTLRFAFSREYHALSGLVSKKSAPEPKQIEQKKEAA